MDFLRRFFYKSRDEGRKRRSSTHEVKPQRASTPPDELEAKIVELMSSEYYQYVSRLQGQVAGKKILDSQAGHSGFLILLDDETWVALFLMNDRLEWLTGAGEPSDEAKNLMHSPQYGDASAPILENRIYANEYCDMTAEVAKAHGMTIQSLAIGAKCFNLAFPDGHELDTMLVTASDGKLSLRVFWERW